MDFVWLDDHKYKLYVELFQNQINSDSKIGLLWDQQSGFHTGSGVHLASCPVGTGALSIRIKALGA